MAAISEPNRVADPTAVPAVALAAGVELRELIAPDADSALGLATLRFEAGATLAVDAGAEDIVLLAYEGDGRAAVDGAAGDHALASGDALQLGAGERATLTAGPEGLALVRMTIGPGCDHHAPLGDRVRVSRLALEDADAATGSRSFQVLFGPENGCTRATVFVGVVPPGAAPWHFHQYDEIVWILRGDARYHQRGADPQPLPAGAAVRIRPRDVHINENVAPAEELLVLGVFTPAGSPSAAYLAG